MGRDAAITKRTVLDKVHQCITAANDATARVDAVQTEHNGLVAFLEADRKTHEQAHADTKLANDTEHDAFVTRLQSLAARHDDLIERIAALEHKARRDERLADEFRLARVRQRLVWMLRWVWRGRAVL